MSKLPPIKTTPIPEHQIANLRDWFLERHNDLKMRESDAEVLKELRGEDSSPLTATELEEKQESLGKLVAPYDKEVKIGQVRLLSPQLINSRIAHVLVLRQFPSTEKDSETFLVVPFGPYQAPATCGELEINSNNHKTKVLQCWLARTVNQEQLELSWILEELDEDTLQKAKAIWKHATFGKEIPTELQNKIGPPIQRDDDPRVLYQQEELELWMHMTSVK